MKIGILTFHRSVNYGAFLQSMALCNRLNQERDIIAEIIDFRMKCDEIFYNFKFQTRRPSIIFHRICLNKTFSKNIKLLSKSSDRKVSDQIEDFIHFCKGKYDVVIAGSDEIWRTDTFRGFPNPYWLPGNLQCKKVAYAVSAAKCCYSDLSKPDREMICEFLRQYEYIGVRDPKTYSELVSIEIPREKLHLCWDPSFVYDFKASARRGKDILINRYNINPNYKTIALMGRNQQLILNIKKKFKGKINIISLFLYNRKTINTPDLSPIEWVDVIAAVDFVITEFFHGACFSIINNTPFFAIETRTNDNETSKLFHLLDSVGLTNRFALNYSEECLEKLLKQIDENFEGRDFDCSEVVNRARLDFENFVDFLKTI